MNSHLTLCWSVKGGQGVTVTTALLALAIQHHGIGVDVIDHTGGDLAAALAVPPFDRRANTLQQAINEAVAVTERVRLLSLDADDPRVQLALLARLEQADQERRHASSTAARPQPGPEAARSNTWQGSPPAPIS